MTKWELYEAATGRSLLELGSPHLGEDPDSWQRVWTANRAEVLEYWRRLRHGGSKPPAFWKFDRPDVEFLPGETEIEAIDRLGLLEPADLDRIRLRVVELRKYPEASRDLPDWDLVRFLESKGE